MLEKTEKKLRDKLANSRLDPESVDSDVLDAVPFKYAGRSLDIQILTEEFTHICPMTGLPDFGQLSVEYVPDQKIIELKSLKYYLVQFRQVGIFYEHVVFHVLDDLVSAVSPRHMVVSYDVSSRGGLTSSVMASWPD